MEPSNIVDLLPTTLPSGGIFPWCTVPSKPSSWIWQLLRKRYQPPSNQQRLRIVLPIILITIHLSRCLRDGRLSLCDTTGRMEDPSLVVGGPIFSPLPLAATSCYRAQWLPPSSSSPSSMSLLVGWVCGVSASASSSEKHHLMLERWLQIIIIISSWRLWSPAERSPMVII